MKVKYFGKSKISFPLPDLLAIQKESWKKFWKLDFPELLKEISPIRDYTKKKLELWFLDYQLGEPKYKTEFEAKESNDSYEAPLKVIVKLINLETKETKKQEIFLSDFPLMTQRGTFIINGVERVVIFQLVRSCGVFFTSKNYSDRNCFGAKIIPERGAWLEFETKPSGFIGVKIDRKREIAATTLLKSLGIKEEETKKIFQDLDIGEIKYIEETLKKDKTHNQEEALIEVYEAVRSGESASSDAAQEFIENLFFNFERYDLTKVGRWKIWQRLPELKSKVKSQKSKLLEEEIKLEDRILKKEDIVAVLREIIRLNNDPGATPDEIDHLGNRRVRTVNEFLQSRLRLAMARLARNIKDRMSTLDVSTLTPIQLINPRIIITAIKEFFTSSQISQFMDNENPLAELEHKRRLTCVGPGGLTRERAGFEVRDVQPSFYGRICPVQTPEGANVGVVSHLASFARLNSYGFLETPYFKVKNKRVSSEVHYLLADEEKKYNIAHAGALTDEKGNLLSQKIDARIKGEPGLCDSDKIDFIDVSTEQSISVSTSLIPFLQNDDANRALMGSNMQRQAVPLIMPRPALVGTGMEEKVARDSGQVIIAEEDGIVEEVDANHIKIKSKVKSQKSKVKSQKSKVYNLQTFRRTNQYTCFHQRPAVKKNQVIKKGDFLTDGGAIAEGKLALGQNLLVAFLPWRGNTFEDAVVISERLVKDDIYSSIHIENFSCDVRETKLGPEITTSDIPNVSEERLRNLDEEGIIRVGAEVSTNDILVGKISPKGEVDLTPEEKLLKAIFGEKAKDVKDTSLRLEHGKRGVVIRVKVFSREDGYHLEPGVIKRIEVEVAVIRKIQAGDKLAGRHGNKGIVAKVLPVEEMPFLEDGTPVDIVLSPLSVISRMNLGQILETHLGWAAQKLGYFAISPALSGATEKDIKEELKKAGLPEDGKTVLYDGRTGLPFMERVTVGYIYMTKLIHLAEDKIHMRSIGPYSLITQQPLGGKSQFGGQRFGEMEVWALEGYGAKHTLQEMLTIKSDDILGRATTYEAILKGEPIKNPNIPASFHLLVNELKAMGLSVEIKEKSKEEKI